MNRMIERKLKNQLKEKEISVDEYLELSDKIELFPRILERFKEITGRTLVKATYHDVLESAWAANEKPDPISQ